MPLAGTADAPMAAPATPTLATFRNFRRGGFSLVISQYAFLRLINISTCVNCNRSSPNGTGRPVGEAGDRCHHHAGKQLHGGDILIVESIGCGGEHFEYPQCILELAQRRGQDGTDTEAMAAQPVNMGAGFDIVAKHDFARPQAFCGDSGSGLEADAEIRCGAAGAGSADDFVSFAKGNCSSGCAGQYLRTLGDYSERGFQVDLRHSSVVVKGGSWIESSMMTRGKVRARAPFLCNLVRGNGVEQFAHNAVHLVVLDEMNGWLASKGTAKETR
jgi:hypothetical protein